MELSSLKKPFFFLWKYSSSLQHLSFSSCLLSSHNVQFHWNYLLNWIINVGDICNIIDKWGVTMNELDIQLLSLLTVAFFKKETQFPHKCTLLTRGSEHQVFPWPPKHFLPWTTQSHITVYWGVHPCFILSKVLWQKSTLEI